jgi:hypothetical protein
MALLPGETLGDLQSVKKESWWYRCLIAFDQMCNVFFLNGQPDETMSSHAGRASGEGKTWGLVLSCFLSCIQMNHCALAEAGDIERGQNVEILDEDSKTKPIF